MLGPVQVWAGDRQIPIGGPRPRALLAALLLHANRVVPAERLIKLLWGGAPPQSARNSLQWQVSWLRRLLAPGGDAAGAGDGASVAAGDRLAFRAPGYRLRLAAGELDLEQFRLLADQGRQALAAGDPARAEELLRRALGLWRGRALEDVDVPDLAEQRARLEQRRLAALEERIESGLRCARHVELVPELTELVAEQPFRERLWGQLMLALYRSGQQAQAQAAYMRLRQRLVEELGVEPCSSVRRLHRQILSADPTLDLPDPPAGSRRPGGRAVPPAPGVVPAQLPAPVARFTGRAGALARLDALHADRFSDRTADQTAGLAGGIPERSGPAVTIIAITGTAGVGKTALAVHWAHQVAGRFPDGQLYINLHGYAPGPPLSAHHALAQLLQAVGVEAERVPAEEATAAGLYRSLLAGKRMLIVLDDVRGAEQVRPLLPGSAGCLVVVTSRDRLAGLVATHGAERLTVDVLAPDEAVALLAMTVGAGRVAAEPGAADKLAEACGFLPLALRIAAANLAGRPGESIEGYVAALSEGDRLASLEVEGDPQAAVRVAFDCSFTALAPEVQRAFCLLGLVPGAEFTAEAAAALCGVPRGKAARLLERLAGAHLVEHRAAGRFAFHDLLRRYARQRVEDCPATERQAALERLLAWYLHTTDAAARLLYPQALRLPLPPAPEGLPPAELGGHTGALAWLDAEQANLVAAVAHAAEHGPRPLAWLLADALRGYFWRRRDTVDGPVVARAALMASMREGDGYAQAAAQLSLGSANRCLGRHTEAAEHYGAAMDLARQASWIDGQAAALGNLGLVHEDMGNLHQAAECCAQALALYRQTGQRAAQANTLGNLGLVYRELGLLEQARDHHAQALALAREIGFRSCEANALDSLGAIDHALGRPDHAHEHLTSALALHQETGNRYGEAYTHNSLAAVYRDTNRPRQALDAAGAAVAIAREIGDRRTEADALTTLGTIHQHQGRTEQAVDCHRRALGLARETGARSAEVNALVGLAAASQHGGEHTGAIEHAERALALAQLMSSRILEAQGRTALAAGHLARGDHTKAIEHAEHAVALNRAASHRLNQARALVVLCHALRQARGDEAALPCWREARSLLRGIGSPDADRIDAPL